MKKELMYLLLVNIIAINVQSCKPPNDKTNAPQQNKPATNITNDTLKNATALAALQLLVENELTKPVSLKSMYFKANDTSAFVSATILKKDGSKMDFKGTPFDEQANIGGSFSDDVFGLLKKDGGTWKVKGISVGATDVPFVCWPKEYKVSASLFPEGTTSNECEDNLPFIFLSNDGHLSLNGGINLDLQEFKEQLKETLLNMDKIPNEILPDFGDKVATSKREELIAIVAEGITVAKKYKDK